MGTYRVDHTASQLVVRARSSLHDTTTTWSQITGDVEADPETLEQAGASATFTVDMTEFDAGDWLKNRKLRKDYQLEQHPRATFTLSDLGDITRADDQFTATARGTLDWRGRQVQLSVTGRGTMTASAIEVSARFDLDIRDLGLKAPKFFIFKVEDEVTVTVTLRATAA